MFIAALYTIAKLRNQLRCPTTNEWIKKNTHTHTLEYYSTIRKSEMISLSGKWMELELMLRETSQDITCSCSLVLAQRPMMMGHEWAWGGEKQGY
jgi:hypothetical protein